MKMGGKSMTGLFTALLPSENSNHRYGLVVFQLEGAGERRPRKFTCVFHCKGFPFITDFCKLSAYFFTKIERSPISL